MECLVIDGGTRVEVDDHAGDSSATKVALQDPGQFTVSEGHHLGRTNPECFKKVLKKQLYCTQIEAFSIIVELILILVVSQGSDAAPQR